MIVIKPPPLTDRQREVMIVLERYFDRNGTCPTIRELGPLIGVSPNVPNGILCHLHALEKKGYICRRDGLWKGSGHSRPWRILKRVSAEPLDAVRTADGIRVRVPNRPLSDEEARDLGEQILHSLEEQPCHSA